MLLLEAFCNKRSIKIKYKGNYDYRVIDIYGFCLPKETYYINVYWHKYKKRCMFRVDRIILDLESDNVLVRDKAKQFIAILEKANPIKEFDMDLFFSLTEKMVVVNDKKIVVGLLDRTEVECVIE